MEIKKYMDALGKYDFAIEFSDYDSGEICLIMQEIADNGVSWCTKSQIEHAMNNSDMADRVVSDGTVGDSSDFDHFNDFVASVGAAVWYEENMETIKENWEECVLYAVCNTLKNEYGVEELNNNQIEELECIIFDEYSRLEDVIREAAETIGIIEDDEDEE